MGMKVMTASKISPNLHKIPPVPPLVRGGLGGFDEGGFQGVSGRLLRNDW